MIDKSITEEFNRLLIEPNNTFEAYFLEFFSCASIVNTESEFSCHMVRVDSSGKDRTEAIAKMVSQRIISYAIPRSEIAKAQELDKEENTTSHITALYKKAQSLFTDLKQTGECGEILLQELLSHVASWQKSLETRITNKGLKKIFIHIFLVPFPSVDRYRQAFLKELNLA